MHWRNLYSLFKRSNYLPIDIEKIRLENGGISVDMLKRDILTPARHRNFSDYARLYYNALAELSDANVERAYRAYLDYRQRVKSLEEIAREPYEKYYEKVMGRKYSNKGELLWKSEHI